MTRLLGALLVLVCLSSPLFSQISLNRGTDEGIDYSNPKEYTIGGITVSGTDNLDPNALVLLSGLSSGDQIAIPGEDISSAIQKLWDQNLFSDVKITYNKITGNTIYLNIFVKERPRLSKFRFTGVGKSEADDLREQINLYREKIVTENLKSTTKKTVRNHFIDKGFLNTDVNVVTKPDSAFPNHVLMVISVKKYKKVRINEIFVEGNKAFTDGKAKRSLKDTKERSVFRPFNKVDTLIGSLFRSMTHRNLTSVKPKVTRYLSNNIRFRIFKSSKYIESNLTADKQSLIAKYRQKGYRDAKIVGDSIVKHDGKSINLFLEVSEGNRYYFRDIDWVGNAKYKTQTLNEILSIGSGDVYDNQLLEKRLFLNQNGIDVSSLYLDDGYLAFNINPVEVRVENDSIDLEIRIFEGQQFRINRVTVAGNTKTNDHVILRELRTKPGQLFNRSDIIRSQRELAQLGYFDPEQFDLKTNPDPVNNTVDLEYVVAEKPSDQIELSGGWGGNRIVGTLGVSFSNFSMRNIFKKGAWSPLPAGDGQRLSVRAQTNGRFFQSYNLSFTEPWLGGRKPNSFSTSAYYSIQTNGETRRTEIDGEEVANPDRQSFEIIGFSLGLGKRLTKPDDYFTFLQELAYQNYNITNWPNFIFNNGNSNNLYYKFTLSRNSISDPLYPRYGSRVSFSGQITFPYSMLNDNDYSVLEDQEKYRWIEYHKWKLTSEWFSKIAGNLVLNTRVGFGVLGSYNSSLGAAPFERFYLGGSGLTGFQLDAREIIALRGYDDQSVSPLTGGTLINKYTMELRYPLSLNPSATIYGLGFVEAGNSWDTFNEYNPLSVKRSAGVGVRIFLPMFGLLGLDWGYRFDDIDFQPGMQRSQVHFTIGANLGEL